MTATGNLASAFASFINGLNPNQLLQLHRHLTQSDEMRGLVIIDDMEQNPAGAASLMGALEQIPNLPQQVTIDVGEALKNPAAPNFGQLMTEAKTALAAAVSTSFLGL